MRVPTLYLLYTGTSQPSTGYSGYAALANVDQRAAGAALTREVVRERLAGRAALRVPSANAEPFRKRKRIQCPGVPASEMLIADRR